MFTSEIVLKPVVNFVSSLETISTPVGFEEVMSKNLSPLIVWKFFWVNATWEFKNPIPDIALSVLSFFEVWRILFYPAESFEIEITKDWKIQRTSFQQGW